MINRRGFLGAVFRCVLYVVVATIPFAGIVVPASADLQVQPPLTDAKPAAVHSVDPVELAETEAKQAGKRVEIESMRAETLTVYANPDGKTLHLEMHTVPVRFQRNGIWEPVDTTLVVDQGVVRPRAARSGLVLSNGGGTKLVGSAQAEKAETDSIAEVFAPATLPAPKLSGDHAEYADAYGRGVDLVVIATPTGFRQRIVLRQRPSGPVSFRVPLRLPREIRLSVGKSGKPALVGKDGTTIAEIPATLMWDAAGGPGDGMTGRAAVTVDDAGSGPVLVFTPDIRFLADPAVS
jgi:hypothetical protein